MFLNNLNNDHFTAAEIVTLLSQLSALENTIAPKAISISKQERKKFSSVNEQNKLVIDKVKEFHLNQPDLSTPHVDWLEFSKDYESRKLTEAVLNRLKSLVEIVENKKITHDYDNLNAALKDYDYCKYQSRNNTAGYQVKLQELAQFYTKKPRTKPSKKE